MSRIQSSNASAGGFVSLVGAGPGDPDLITVRGLNALSNAEVVLYDALVDPTFQRLFPTSALGIPVGKRCGVASTDQAEIHALMITHARAGRRVVRLKGGDPMIFGRGGEEARALQDAGIPFEIVPGISAIQGAAATAGIPLTHRRVSRRITLMEGHHLPEDPAVWRDLARGEGTLAVYMGTRRIPEIAQALLAQGADPSLPMALVEKTCCPDQTTTYSSLALAAQGALQPLTDGPGILLFGDSIDHRTQPESPHESVAALPESGGQARALGGRRERRPSQAFGIA